MPMKKSPQIRELERVIEDHDRRYTQAVLAGQKNRAHFHKRQKKIWSKQLARVAAE